MHAKRRDPGRRVVLLEAHTIGWAASGRNGGFCEASLTHGEDNGRARWPEEYDVLERLGADNLDAFEADVRDLGLDCEWERTGMLAVAVEEHQVAWLRDEPHVLDRAQVRAEIDSPLFLGRRSGTPTAARWCTRPGSPSSWPGSRSTLGVEIHEHSAVTGLRRRTVGLRRVEVLTDRATVTSDHVVLATNVFPSLLRRNRLMTVPVYDYVLMTEPLSAEQLASVGWAGRQGLGDLANQFHYSRLSADHRILWGGYDAIYPAGGRVASATRTGRDATPGWRRTSSRPSPSSRTSGSRHRWAGAIDTCTQFTAFYGLTHGGRVAHAAGFTGLGVGATRFAARGAARPAGRASRPSAPSCGWCASARCRSRRSRSRRSGSTSPAGRSTAPTTGRAGATPSCGRSTRPGWASTPEAARSGGGASRARSARRSARIRVSTRDTWACVRPIASAISCWVRSS